MLSKVHSLGLAGIAGYEVETECYIGTGLPADVRDRGPAGRVGQGGA